MWEGVVGILMLDDFVSFNVMMFDLFGVLVVVIVEMMVDEGVCVLIFIGVGCGFCLG